MPSKIVARKNCLKSFYCWSRDMLVFESFQSSSLLAQFELSRLTRKFYHHKTSKTFLKTASIYAFLLSGLASETIEISPSKYPFKSLISCRCGRTQESLLTLAKEEIHEPLYSQPFYKYHMFFIVTETLI